MVPDLNGLLKQYENGSLTRRQLLGALAAALVAAPVPAKAQSSVGQATQLNHVTAFVPDVQRSAAFYQDLLDMPVLTLQEPGINLSAGAGFLGIYPSQGEPASINHFCLGLDGFDAEATRGALAARGLEARIRLRGDTQELYFTDPDGLNVQLQDSSYIGGVGRLGNEEPA